MKKELKEYIESVENALKKKKVTKEILSIHMDKIAFFQHERLIHLIVTCLFSLLTIIVLIASLLVDNILLLVLFFVLLLLVPYICHYYYLENNVQYLYKLYDKLVDIDAKLLKK